MAREDPKQTTDLSWVVPRRSQLQQLALEVYEFERTLGPGKRERLWPVLGYLIGIAFSLWRAVFLVLPERKETSMHKQGEDILRIVLETNAVGFPQDKATAQWMAGYYNNNAILRLSDMYTDPIALAVIRDVLPENFQETPLGWYRPERQLEFSNLDPRRQWEIAFDAFEMTFRLLQQVNKI